MNKIFAALIVFAISWSASVFAALKLDAIQASAYLRDDLPTAGTAGFISLNRDEELYVHVFNANSNLAPIVFLNGLSQDLSDWAALFPEIEKSGHPLVFLDNLYQGRSLYNYLSKHDAYSRVLKFPSDPVTTPLLYEEMYYGGRPPIFPDAPIELQSKDLFEVLQKLGVKQKVHLVGLSYGGGWALEAGSSFASQVQSLILLAPYVAPLETQDQMIKSQMSLYRTMYPFVPYSMPAYSEQLYDFMLRRLVYTTYAISEPNILRWGYSQVAGAFALIRGIRKIDSKKLALTIPDRSLHLVISGLDQYIPEQMLRQFYQDVPGAKRASVFLINGIEHKSNESVGPYLASYINTVVAGGWSTAGESWSGDPKVGQAVNDTTGQIVSLTSAIPREISLLKPVYPNQPNLPISRIDETPGHWLSQDKLSPPR